MNKEQIAFLMNAGYSVEEIMSMTQNPDPAPIPVQNPEPTPTPKPNPDPTPAPDITARIDALFDAVEKFTHLVQKDNIGGISFGNPPQERTAEDILAEIINPPQKK